jgi:hypothetical protein
LQCIHFHPDTPRHAAGTHQHRYWNTEHTRKQVSLLWNISVDTNRSWLKDQTQVAETALKSPTVEKKYGKRQALPDLGLLNVCKYKQAWRAEMASSAMLRALSSCSIKT